MGDFDGGAPGNPRRVTHPDLVPEAPAGEAPTPNPAPADAANPPEERKFVGGRLRTFEEAIEGYSASEQEALRLRQELMTERSAREAERRVREEMALQREAPAPLDTDDPRALREAFRAEARAVFQAELQQALAPLAKIGAATAAIKAVDPQFDPYVVRNAIADPDDLRIFDELQQTNPEAALRFGWRAVQASRPAPKQQAVDQAAMVAAGQAPQRTAPAPTNAQARAKLLEEALAKATETGDWESYYRERAKGTSIDRGAELQRLIPGR